MPKSNWRRRTKGTSRQRGKAFKLNSGRVKGAKVSKDYKPDIDEYEKKMKAKLKRGHVIQKPTEQFVQLLDRWNSYTPVSILKELDSLTEQLRTMDYTFDTYFFAMDGEVYLSDEGTIEKVDSLEEARKIVNNAKYSI